MKNDYEKIIDNLETNSVQMSLNGLDLLDEYYNQQSEFDNVLACRTLKQKIRDHTEDYKPIPTHLIN